MFARGALDKDAHITPAGVLAGTVIYGADAFCRRAIMGWRAEATA
jgi:hypothetical protein